MRWNIIIDAKEHELLQKFRENQRNKKYYYIEDYDVCADVPTYYLYKDEEYFYTTLKEATAFTKEEAQFHLKNIQKIDSESGQLNSPRIVIPKIRDFLELSETDIEYQRRSEMMLE